MILTEDETIEKHAKQSMPSTRNILLPYEYEWTCNACGCNIFKKKSELNKLSRKKIHESIKKC